MFDSHYNNNGNSSQDPLDWSTYGYVRASSDKQVLSPEVQVERIGGAAIQIAPHVKDNLAQWLQSNVAPFVDAGISGDKIPYTERPGFVRLMTTLKPDDRLIVWRLDRLDRKAVRIINAMEWLREHRIHVFNLEHGIQYIDPGLPINQLLVVISAGLAGYENDKKTEASKYAKAYMKAAGTYLHGNTIPGFRLIWRERKHKRPSRAYAHDEAERQVIREFCKLKLEHGVRTADILKDLRERGIRTPIGRKWGRWRVNAICSWWKGCLERGLEPWVDCIPYTFDPPPSGL